MTTIFHAFVETLEPEFCNLYTKSKGPSFRYTKYLEDKALFVNSVVRTLSIDVIRIVSTIAPETTLQLDSPSAALRDLTATGSRNDSRLSLTGLTHSRAMSESLPLMKSPAPSSVSRPGSVVPGLSSRHRATILDTVMQHLSAYTLMPGREQLFQGPTLQRLATSVMTLVFGVAAESRSRKFLKSPSAVPVSPIPPCSPVTRHSPRPSTSAGARTIRGASRSGLSGSPRASPRPASNLGTRSPTMSVLRQMPAEEVKRDFDMMCQANRKLSVKVAELTTQLDDTTPKLRELEKVKRRSQSRLDSVYSLKARVAQAEHTEAELSSAKSALGKVHDELEDATAHLAELGATKESLEAAVFKLKKEAQFDKRHYQGLISAYETQLAERALMPTASTQTDCAWHDMVAKRELAVEETQRLGDIIDSLKAERGELRDRVAALTGQLKRAADDELMVREANIRLQKQCSTKNGEADIARRLKDAAEVELDELQVTLAQREKDALKWEYQYQRIKKDFLRLQEFERKHADRIYEIGDREIEIKYRLEAARTAEDSVTDIIKHATRKEIALDERQRKLDGVTNRLDVERQDAMMIAERSRAGVRDLEGMHDAVQAKLAAAERRLKGATEELEEITAANSTLHRAVGRAKAALADEGHDESTETLAAALKLENAQLLQQVAIAEAQAVEARRAAKEDIAEAERSLSADREQLQRAREEYAQLRGELRAREAHVVKTLEETRDLSRSQVVNLGLDQSPMVK